MKQECQFHTKHDGSWWFSDVKGIPLCRVCADCIREKLSHYKSAVTGSERSYEEVIEENIEEDS